MNQDGIIVSPITSIDELCNIILEQIPNNVALGYSSDIYNWFNTWGAHNFISNLINEHRSINTLISIINHLPNGINGPNSLTAALNFIGINTPYNPIAHRFFIIYVFPF
jgi:hypothetical protein